MWLWDRKKIMMKRFVFVLTLSVMSASLAACGFTPMYGKNSSHSQNVTANLSQVQIENIPNREGQFLRNELIDKFYKGGRPTDPAYVLEVAPIRERITDLDLTRSSDVTRAQLRLSSTMVLKSTETGEVLLNRALSATSSYNVLGEEFATRFSEQSTRENALKDLARQIELQLGLYFTR